MNGEIPKTGGNKGTVIGTIIVILLLIIAAVYLLRTRVTTPPPDEALQSGLQTIEQDAEAVDLSELDAELQNLDDELKL